MDADDTHVGHPAVCQDPWGLWEELEELREAVARGGTTVSVANRKGFNELNAVISIIVGAAMMRFQDKLRKRALKHAFRSLRYGWTMDSLARLPLLFPSATSRRPRRSGNNAAVPRALPHRWLKHALETSVVRCFRLATALDVWWEEKVYSKPRWTHHGHVHRRRQAFRRWQTEWWQKSMPIRRSTLLTYFAPTASEAAVRAREERETGSLFESYNIRHRILKGIAARFLKRWKRLRCPRLHQVLNMLATRHVVGACYAKWSKFRSHVKSQRAARDLLRDEEQEAQESAKKAPSKRKKRKGKRAAVSDLHSIEEDCVATTVLNLADLTTIEPDDDSSEFIDVASSSVATALTCVVCFHGASEFAIVPCGHRCLCENCSAKFKSGASNCPVCRGPVRETLKIFG